MELDLPDTITLTQGCPGLYRKAQCGGSFSFQPKEAKPVSSKSQDWLIKKVESDCGSCLTGIKTCTHISPLRIRLDTPAVALTHMMPRDTEQFISNRLIQHESHWVPSPHHGLWFYMGCDGYLCEMGIHPGWVNSPWLCIMHTHVYNIEYRTMAVWGGNATRCITVKTCLKSNMLKSIWLTSIVHKPVVISQVISWSGYFSHMRVWIWKTFSWEKAPEKHCITYNPTSNKNTVWICQEARFQAFVPLKQVWQSVLKSVVRARGTGWLQWGVRSCAWWLWCRGSSTPFSHTALAL